jgi:hypothetical protein
MAFHPRENQKEKIKYKNCGMDSQGRRIHAISHAKNSKQEF